MQFSFRTNHSTETVALYLISSRLDYCDALFAGFPKKTVARLQLIQNNAAIALTGTRKTASDSIQNRFQNFKIIVASLMLLVSAKSYCDFAFLSKYRLNNVERVCDNNICFIL